MPLARSIHLNAMKDLGSERAFDDAVKVRHALLVNIIKLLAFSQQAKDKLVVVDFATTWCGPCKVMEPKVTELSECVDAAT